MADEPGVFLIHGLGGTQYDLGSMHKRLKNAGFVTHSLTLPGHGTKPEDLVDVRAEDWIEAVRVKYREVVGQHQTLHVMGMCMGALLAAETAKREQHANGRLVALAPPIYIDGWATPWYRGLRPLLYRIPTVPERMKVAEEDPYGIKNEQLREIVKAKFERGENFHYGWVPLACLREVDRLRGMVMKGLDRIACPALVVHARQDELTSLRSAHYLVERIGVGKRAGQARMVVLEDSYHMICVDNDREIVVKNVLEFLDASAAGSLGMTHDDPRMTPAQMAELLSGAQSDLARGDFAALYERGIPDFAWYQAGANRTSGIFRGRKGLARLQTLERRRRGVHRVRCARFQRRHGRRARDDAIGRAHVAGRARVRVAPGPIAGSALVSRRAATRRPALWRRADTRWSDTGRARIRGRGCRVEDPAQGAGQRHAARALFAVQARQCRRRDRRAPRRDGRRGTRKVRRVARPARPAARAGDERIRRAGRQIEGG